MKLAIVAGGWHWPLHLFRTLAAEFQGADLFVIAHRSPELPIVREEKRGILTAVAGPLADLDRQLYEDFPTIQGLQQLGWNYREEANTCGDFEFLNQWLDRHDYRQYDLILNCHDDTFIRNGGLFMQQMLLFQHLADDWLLLANGRYPEAPEAYVRGSFEFWKPQLLDMLGGRIDLGAVELTREGKTDTPAGMDALSAWNATCVPLREFMIEKEIAHQVQYLSPHYRISPWVIEAERGFLHYSGGAPWSFEAGLKAFPLEVAV